MPRGQAGVLDDLAPIPDPGSKYSKAGDFSPHWTSDSPLTHANVESRPPLFAESDQPSPSSIWGD